MTAAPCSPPSRLAAPSARRSGGRGSSSASLGSLLLVLIFTHLFFNLVTGDGVSQIDFGFVAGKWAAPLWQWWDFAMLVLALLHGGNGMRMIINDYAHGRYMPRILHWSLRISCVARRSSARS